MKEQSITPIIILNWNGWTDTIVCLKSLFSSQNTDFCVIVADNNSADESIRQIVNWLEVNRMDFVISKDGDKIASLQSRFTYIFKFSSNYGFAKGNNNALASITDCNFENALLLNNDTEVTPDFLSKLIDFKENNPEYKVLTPLICYYDKKDKVWNAGGQIFCGFRKYFYADQNIQDVKQEKRIDISFITGCALLFQKELMVNNKLFTERFFFGEEDFEFSLRMKKNKIKMACVTDSVIFHKVSSSTLNIPNINKIYVYYLNRFINIKLNSTPLFYIFWKHGYMVYIYLLLKRQRFTHSEVFAFLKKLYLESERFDEVNHEMFRTILGIKKNDNNGINQ